MSTFTSLVRRAPKRFSAIALMIASAVIIPAAVMAWGPTRDTYTMASPANKITFNSITDNPNIGDERNFVGIREAGSANVWYDDMTVQKNKEYIVRMYVHNNAAANLNLVAEGVTAKFNLPTTTGKSIQVNGFLSASNSHPAEVYDHATFKGSENFNLAYIGGSLKYENNVFGSTGVALPESIFTSKGALLGYNKLDGKIPGCLQFAGYVTFKVKPQFATTTTDFTIKKEVRKVGGTFSELVNVKPGDKLNYRITYKNTGTAQANNVILKDTLPAGVTATPGSVIIANANHPGGATLASGDTMFTSGVNIGHYTSGSNAIVVFDATVTSNDKLPICGPNLLRNKASAQPQGQNPKDDTADVTVPKECEPGKISVCELSTKKIITINEDQFDSSKHTKDLTKCDSTTTEKINVCELATNKIISIKESEFDAKKHSKDLTKCELPQTGPTENIVALVGLSALIASIAYYVASRRALNQ
jgi:uncharacterized repeat protein (TIGR01451 family)